MEMRVTAQVKVLLNLILHHLLEVQLGNVLVFNCWPTRVRRDFAQLMSTNYIRMQLVNLEDNSSFSWQQQCSLSGIFLDCNCNGSVQILEKANNLRLFNSHFHWLLYDAHANMSQLRALIEDYNIAVDADITYIQPSSNSSACWNDFHFTDVYNNGRSLGGALNMTADRIISCDCHNCFPPTYLSDLHLRTKYGNRQLLSDITMRASVVLTSMPLSSPENEKIAFLESIDGERDIIPRFGFPLVQLARDMLQFNLSLRFFNVWSTTETKGGAVGALIDGDVEILGNAIVLTMNRLRYLTPVVATNQFRSVFSFLTPRNSQIQAKAFLQPFSPMIWYIFAGVLTIIGFLLWLTFGIERHRMHMYLDARPSLVMALLMSMGSACAQGSQIIPRSVGGRILFTTLMIITFIMYNYYTSLVVSTLLGSSVKSDITTLRQLADSNLKVAMEPVPYNLVYLNTSQLPDVRRFVERKIAKQNPQDVFLPQREGINRMLRDPGFVFMFESNTGYRVVEKLFTQQEICDLNEVYLRYKQYVYTLVHRNSSYREIQRQMMVRWQEVGILKKYRKFFLRSRPVCFANNLVIDVGLEYTAPLFIMLIGSIVLAYFILAIEKALSRFHQHKINFKSFILKLVEGH